MVTIPTAVGFKDPNVVKSYSKGFPAFARNEEDEFYLSGNSAVGVVKNVRR